MDNPQVNVLKSTDMTSETLIGIKPEQSAFDEVMEICRQEDRKKAWVALQLFYRGLAQYHRDGLVREPEKNELGKKRKTG